MLSSLGKKFHAHTNEPTYLMRCSNCARKRHFRNNCCALMRETEISPLRWIGLCLREWDQRKNLEKMSGNSMEIFLKCRKMRNLEKKWKLKLVNLFIYVFVVKEIIDKFIFSWWIGWEIEKLSNEWRKNCMNW